MHFSPKPLCIGIGPSHGDEVLIRELSVCLSIGYTSPGYKEGLRAATFIVLVVALGMSQAYIKSLVLGLPSHQM